MGGDGWELNWEFVGAGRTGCGEADLGLGLETIGTRFGVGRDTAVGRSWSSRGGSVFVIGTGGGGICEREVGMLCFGCGFDLGVDATMGPSLSNHPESPGSISTSSI